MWALRKIAGGNEIWVFYREAKEKDMNRKMNFALKSYMVADLFLFFLIGSKKERQNALRSS